MSKLHVDENQVKLLSAVTEIKLCDPVRSI